MPDAYSARPVCLCAATLGLIPGDAVEQVSAINLKLICNSNELLLHTGNFITIRLELIKNHASKLRV